MCKGDAVATVVLIGTLDTKGIEYRYVKECIQETGANVFMIDTGILGEPFFKPDIYAYDVAAAAGIHISDIRFSMEESDTRTVAIEAMSKGLEIYLNRLIEEGKCDAVFAMGGSGGTYMASSVFKKLPLGMPKMIVSTMMSGDVRPFIGGSDITMMYSVTDFAGLNPCSRQIFANAAHAVAGMALHYGAAKKRASHTKKPLIAITMFNVTAPGVLRIRSKLEEAGFEIIIFHASGVGGKSMEKMVRMGLIDGVIDYTISELCDYEFGGEFSAGPDRLTAAGEMGIPQVIVPGGLEILNFRSIEAIPLYIDAMERKLIIHSATVCALKASDDELARLGRIVGEKASQAKGPAAVVFPLKGLDKYQAQGGPWSDLSGNQVLLDAIRRSLGPAVELVKADHHINDPEFADLTVEKFFELWNARNEFGQTLNYEQSGLQMLK